MAHRFLVTSALALLVATLPGLAEAGGGKGAGKGKAKGKAKGEDSEYPGRNWETGSPEAHGLSEQGLAELHGVAEALQSTCLLVIHDGVLVSEWYAPGYGRDTMHANVFSVTKSITSAVFGIARDEGLLDLDDKASTYIAEWSSTPSAGVTLRNLLSNDSGRFWSMESDYGALLFGADHTAYGVGLEQQFPPGTHWEYNNAAIQTLDRVFEAALGGDIEPYAQEKLFGPIGMTAKMGRDPAGNALTYQGVSTSCDGLARFGLLMERQGRWKGKQIVSEGWVTASTSPSTALNDAYGYLWWVNREGQVVGPTFPERNEYDERLVPAASEAHYFAIGAFGQLVIVDPTSGYVVVRLQDVLDLEQAMATDPDPLGVGKLQTVLTAFQKARR